MPLGGGKAAYSNDTETIESVLKIVNQDELLNIREGRRPQFDKDSSLKPGCRAYILIISKTVHELKAMILAMILAASVKHAAWLLNLSRQIESLPDDEIFNLFYAYVILSC